MKIVTKTALYRIKTVVSIFPDNIIEKTLLAEAVVSS